MEGQATPTVSAPPKSALLPNYPNPFNPETWIPFQIAEGTTVHITIYGPAGQIVRTLELGSLPAGTYTTRSKAAYWDGTNDAGERVASGPYFYRIEAGSYSAMRRMVILK
ncbi:MAG: FlgD immunoglobulin-like domain containing protein [Nanoarchaeota archaeon]|nr:FlgD immunoglobulin-like domain containing protein [Nanoarchaeota archaeon]